MEHFITTAWGFWPDGPRHDVDTDSVSHPLVLCCLASRWPQNCTGMTHIPPRLELNYALLALLWVRYWVTATMCVFATGTCQSPPLLFFFKGPQKRRNSFFIQSPPLPTTLFGLRSNIYDVFCFRKESNVVWSTNCFVMMIFFAVYCRLDSRASSVLGLYGYAAVLVVGLHHYMTHFNICSLLCQSSSASI